MIRRCTDGDFEAIYETINDSASAYKGVIPADRWKSPYMTRDELRVELGEGVTFWGYEDGGRLVAVMGVQDVRDVTLIRHAYVRTDMRGRGIGGELLKHLLGGLPQGRPVLVGTWATVCWAVRFYERHGFRLVGRDDKDRLLRAYWNISERQIETSVVLADANYWKGQA